MAQVDTDIQVTIGTLNVTGFYPWFDALEQAWGPGHCCLSTTFRSASVTVFHPCHLPRTTHDHEEQFGCGMAEPDFEGGVVHKRRGRSWVWSLGHVRCPFGLVFVDGTSTRTARAYICWVCDHATTYHDELMVREPLQYNTQARDSVHRARSQSPADGGFYTYDDPFIPTWTPRQRTETLNI